jgi:Outer membrane protein
MKKIIVSLLFLLPLGLMAQELKIAFVNTNEILNTLPDYTDVENEMTKMTQQYQQEAKIMEDRFNRMYQDYISQADSLAENIKVLRMQEIQDLQNRMDNFYPMAQEEMQKKQQALMAPIQEKIQKAINSVGEENGYTFMISPQVLLYKSDSAIDATDKVKAKLGIK